MSVQLAGLTRVFHRHLVVLLGVVYAIARFNEELFNAHAEGSEHGQCSGCVLRKGM
jgi:hypothetical protein